MALRALILGAAAGGGLPQWNCAAPNSAGFWGRGARLDAATQSSLAVSVDGARWVVLNASPDIRAQIMARPQLHPRDAGESGLRNSPIAAVVITNADIDHVAGLLSLRESQAFDLWTTDAIAEILAANPIFDALNPALVRRRRLALDEAVEVTPGLSVELFAVPGKVPLFLEGETVETDLMGEQTAGVRLSAGGAAAFYIPGCARMTPELAERLRGAALVFFDGTVFHDDEMIRLGVGTKTGRRMGHMAMAGPEGSLAAFAPLDVARKVYVHINNTNPVWNPASPERATVEAAGWEVGRDGMEITL
ncbi:MAG: pyrroloquinoline quinone biosynthesis protein PqqB [Rhodobacterales bacterium CG18_big_fil_WC_8_21_14_2_50_71_9]|nr:MAG: pyrroloquinoline quinone biosynthesis protein PqqB [Rhodobacterales bacterium CG18_big_fil_WC_8_21_14_2_50_71_9]PIY73250.1 MAG: pyrroloquinoline quinone biosynthesis protein PqqB [Rhodobacterales bacterium CG_4_10_14_0_8_um_filter_70_9]PJA59001.1 MAG: pyrroloquinoline quinone biosynthesis protein PqqB [Rhodobacterales bacterium CG_4_9_14_3_um_filter_71_31]